MGHRRLLRLAGPALGIGLVALAPGAQAQTTGDPDAGRAYAERNCTNCHLVSPQQSPHVRVAPSFQAIAGMPSTTSMSLHAFLATPHPRMPNFIVPPSDADDVVAYVLSLQKKP